MFRRSSLALFCCLVPLAAGRDGKDQKGRKPVMGWNTWCTQDACETDWCSSAEVLDVAREMKDNGMQALGYDHINLGGGWTPHLRATAQRTARPTPPAPHTSGRWQEAAR